MTASDLFRGLWRNRRQRAIISVHRGLWGPAPENSLAALTAGASIGIVETDIQLAADYVPVVMHDDTLDRMTGVPGRIADTTSDEFAKLPLREGYGGTGSKLTKHRAPLFEELLAISPKDSFFDFDVKHPHEVEAVAAFIASHGATTRGSVKIDTKNEANIDHLLGLEAEFGVMVMAKVMLSDAGLGHVASLADRGVAAAEVWFDDLDQLAAACRIAGNRMAVSTYTLDPVHCCGLSDSVAQKNPSAVWGRLIEAGISIIMTDRPRELAEYLDTL